MIESSLNTIVGKLTVLPRCCSLQRCRSGRMACAARSNPGQQSSIYICPKSPLCVSEQSGRHLIPLWRSRHSNLPCSFPPRFREQQDAFPPFDNMSSSCAWHKPMNLLTNCAITYVCAHTCTNTKIRTLLGSEQTPDARI